MGRKGALEVEKEIKLVDDPAIVQRVETIGEAIAEIANSLEVESTYGSSRITPFKYKIKVIDDKEMNAFSLPGGHIYVNTGLLDYIQSDHELAGVLAHEFAHASHHHMAYLLKEQSKLDGRIALVLLAGIMGNMDAQDLSHVLIGAQLVRIACSSGYGQKAEADADRTAITYLNKAGYNPVGLLTFMERLARDYSTGPQVDMGIYRTHPPSRDRAKATIAQIEGLGLPIKRREVTDAIKAVTACAGEDDKTLICVKLADDVIFEPAPIGESLTSEQRAQIIATKINQLLDQEPQFRQIKLDSDKRTVLARGEPVIVVTDEDAALSGKSAPELAEQAAEALRTFIWKQTLQEMY
jgi:predicted Zn-dependent protease